MSECHDERQSNMLDNERQSNMLDNERQSNMSDNEPFADLSETEKENVSNCYYSLNLHDILLSLKIRPSVLCWIVAFQMRACF